MDDLELAAYLVAAAFLFPLPFAVFSQAFDDYLMERMPEIVEKLEVIRAWAERERRFWRRAL